jgi:hypothetical protein
MSVLVITLRDLARLESRQEGPRPIDVEHRIGGLDAEKEAIA